MKKIALAMAVVLACGISTAAQEQRFTVSGNIDGLEKGDTLRFRQIILPGWKDGDTFDVVLKKDSRFKYKGRHMTSITSWNTTPYPETFRHATGQERR